MKHDFSAAMRRATQAVRAGDLTAATRTIRAALSGQASNPTPEPARAPRLHAEVEEAEIVTERGPLAGFFARMPPCAPCGATPAPATQSSDMIARTHRCAAGARDYRLFLPASGARNGVLMMLHGCKQNPEDFARGTRMNAIAEAQGLIVVWPQQGRDANMMSCWNWFETSHQARGQGEPEILASLAREVAREFAVDSGAVWVAGLSAGGAMAAVLGEAYPEVFSAIGIHSGLPVGAARDTVSAFNAMAGRGAGKAALSATGPRVIVFHGDADRTVSPANVKQIVGSARPAGRSSGTAGGRSYQVTTYARQDGRLSEVWSLHGAGHAWAGGSSDGSFADPIGPDASAEMARFFLQAAPAHH